MQHSSGNTDGRGKGYFALSITSLLWGTTWVASKVGVMEMPALQMAYIRQFIAGLCFVIFFMWYKKEPLPTKKQFGWLFVMAGLMFVIANGMSTWSLKFIPTGSGRFDWCTVSIKCSVDRMDFLQEQKNEPAHLYRFVPWHNRSRDRFL
ncbi:MAG: DMT family transporter [Ferruginibacter sp.]